MITHSRTYRFDMAVFEEFDLQCSGADIPDNGLFDWVDYALVCLSAR